MTRKRDSIDDRSHFHCPGCQTTCCIETNGSLCGKRKPLHPVEDILSFEEENHNSQTTDLTALRNTLNTADLSPVELTKGKEKKDRTTIKTEFEYVSLSPQLIKRAKSQGAVKFMRQKRDYYFGKMDEHNVRVVSVRRTKSADRRYFTMSKDSHGITESSVFFSPIGEWTIIDLNLKTFEKEDAKRTVYLRRKRASYKEVAPENICRIL